MINAVCPRCRRRYAASIKRTGLNRSLDLVYFIPGISTCTECGLDFHHMIVNGDHIRSDYIDDRNAHRSGLGGSGTVLHMEVLDRDRAEFERTFRPREMTAARRRPSSEEFRRMTEHLSHRYAGVPSSMIGELTRRAFIDVEEPERRVMGGLTDIITRANKVEKEHKSPLKPKPREIPKYMRSEYNKIPDETREKIEEKYIGAFAKFSSEEFTQINESELEKAIRKRLVTELSNELIKKGLMKKVGTTERGNETIKQFEGYVFQMEEWIDIVIDIFYAGFDYANEQNNNE